MESVSRSPLRPEYQKFQKTQKMIQAWDKGNLHSKDEVGELVEMRVIDEPESEPLLTQRSQKDLWGTIAGKSTLDETK